MNDMDELWSSLSDKLLAIQNLLENNTQFKKILEPLLSNIINLNFKDNPKKIKKILHVIKVLKTVSTFIGPDNQLNISKIQKMVTDAIQN